TSPNEITLSPRTKKVIELAVDESRKLGHSHVGTEHLLLGVVREGESVGAGLLQSMGVSLEQVRHQVIALMGQHRPEMGATAAAPRNEGPRPARLDEQAALTEVFARAASFASERNSALIRSGHLLLAIAAADSAGGNVLKAVGATPGCIREILDRMNG